MHTKEATAPVVSVIMPVYNVEKYVAAAIESVLEQTYGDFELLIVDDGGNDSSMTICRRYADPRINILEQENRGLAGARNTGIHYSRGKYLAFLDSDDIWEVTKLASHVEHLDQAPEVGVSYCPSGFIDDDGRRLGIFQSPKLTAVTAGDVVCRNPVGNGSAPVIRREVFDEIAFSQTINDTTRMAYFDETFRQSEDIECWVRIAASTQWRFEGISEVLTLYRVNAGGLSANLENQYAQWERMVLKAEAYAPDFIATWGSLARAFQLRYLARRAVRMRQGPTAVKLVHRALLTDPRILFKEPVRTVITLLSAYLLRLLPERMFRWLELNGMKLIGGLQVRTMRPNRI